MSLKYRISIQHHLLLFTIIQYYLLQYYLILLTSIHYYLLSFSIIYYYLLLFSIIYYRSCNISYPDLLCITSYHFWQQKTTTKSWTFVRYFRTPQNAHINRTSTDNNWSDIDFDLVFIDVSSTCSNKSKIKCSPIHPSTFPGNPAQTTTDPTTTTTIRHECT